MKKNQIAETNSRKNQTKGASASGELFASKNREIFQELREIKNEVKEVKKLLVANSLRRLMDNYVKLPMLNKENWKRSESWPKRMSRERKKLPSGIEYNPRVRKTKFIWKIKGLYN